MSEIFIKLISMIPFALVFVNLFWYSENKSMKQFAYNSILLCFPSLIYMMFVFDYYK